MPNKTKANTETKINKLEQTIKQTNKTQNSENRHKRWD